MSMSSWVGDHTRGVEAEIARMRIVELVDDLTDKELIWLAGLLAGLPHAGRLVKALLSWPEP